uniref:Uncharacterized protein n=1 Tax=Arundo donax TaxID=35708 RepID=A0A0A9F5S7_ARUDO
MPYNQIMGIINMRQQQKLSWLRHYVEQFKGMNVITNITMV